MSYAAAIDAIKALLVADPISTDHPTVTLHYAPDPRLDTLADLDGYVDGAFLLVASSSGNPYPYNQGSLHRSGGPVLDLRFVPSFIPM